MPVSADDISERYLKKAIAEINELGHEIACHGLKWIHYQNMDEATERRHMDMNHAAQIRRYAAKLGDKPIDVLFCNAGINGKRGMALGSFDFDSWEEVDECCFAWLVLTVTPQMLHFNCSSVTVSCACTRYKNSKPFIGCRRQLIDADRCRVTCHSGAHEEPGAACSQPHPDQDVGRAAKGRARPRLQHQPELF